MNINWKCYLYEDVCLNDITFNLVRYWITMLLACYLLLLLSCAQVKLRQEVVTESGRLALCQKS